MCGITGFYTPGHPFNPSWANPIIQKMTDTLNRRGPDDQGIYLDPHHGLALGHRRLSIIDTSNHGHQPMISDNGRYILVYNGEIYNFPELKKQLDYPFQSNSDTEVILASCQEWGIEKTLSKLIGMFAFSLWDQKEKKLYLARDRVGVKPLFWGQYDRTILFGSELKPLMAFTNFKPNLNLEAVQLYFQYNYIPCPLSIFEGIHKIRPGTFIVINSDGHHKEHIYWQASDYVQPAERLPDNFHDGLEEILKDAVQKRMISDVPLGAFLSGGIDSSTVVALMQSQSTKPIRTFTVGFEDPHYNEAVHAKAIAQHLGTEHTEVTLDYRDALDIIPNMPTWFDEPFADSSQLPTYLVSKIARQDVTVALSGDGGDEVFAGYRRHVFAANNWPMLSKIPVSLRQGLGKMLRANHSNILGLNKHLKINQLSNKLHKISNLLMADDAVAVYKSLTQIWQNSGTLMQSSMDVSAPFTPELQGDFLRSMQYWDLMTYLPDDILTKVDRASMAVGLEARVPLLDHRVIEYAWQAPSSMFIEGKNSKHLLRRILYKYVPQDLIDRPKMGFSIPLDDWLRGPLKEWAGDLLSPDRLKSQGILNADHINTLWQEHSSGRQSYKEGLWGILMFQAWLDSYAKENIISS